MNYNTFRKCYCYNNDISAFSPPPIAKQKDLLQTKGFTIWSISGSPESLHNDISTSTRTRTQYAYAVRVPGTIWLFNLAVQLSY